jgi:hypothetical protein
MDADSIREAEDRIAALQRGLDEAQKMLQAAERAQQAADRAREGAERLAATVRTLAIVAVSGVVLVSLVANVRRHRR